MRGITDYSPQWPKSAELQTTARTYGSSPAEIDSQLVSHRRLDMYQWWLVTGTRSYLQDFCRLLTQSLSYLQPVQCTQTLMSSDLIEQLLHRNNYRH